MTEWAMYHPFLAMFALVVASYTLFEIVRLFASMFVAYQYRKSTETLAESNRMKYEHYLGITANHEELTESERSFHESFVISAYTTLNGI